MSRPRLSEFFSVLFIAAALLSATARGAAPPPIAIVIHGGAGVIEPAKMTAAGEASYRAGLAAALDAGYDVLERGGTSTTPCSSAKSSAPSATSSTCGLFSITRRASSIGFFT